LLAGERDVGNMTFDCGDYCFDLFHSVTRIVVFFAARAAAVFLVDLAYFLGVAAEVDVLVWFGSGLGCRYGWWDVRVRCDCRLWSALIPLHERWVVRDGQGRELRCASRALDLREM
jgi:hypothetical protein